MLDVEHTVQRGQIEKCASSVCRKRVIVLLNANKKGC